LCPTSVAAQSPPSPLSLAHMLSCTRSLYSGLYTRLYTRLYTGLHTGLYTGLHTRLHTGLHTGLGCPHTKITAEFPRNQAKKSAIRLHRYEFPAGARGKLFESASTLYSNSYPVDPTVKDRPHRAPLRSQPFRCGHFCWLLIDPASPNSSVASERRCVEHGESHFRLEPLVL
jgi:hypothetical protein